MESSKVDDLRIRPGQSIESFYDERLALAVSIVRDWSYTDCLDHCGCVCVADGQFMRAATAINLAGWPDSDDLRARVNRSF